MTIYYNSKINSFYDSNISKIPENSVKVTDRLHSELFKKQAKGFIIQSDENGNPIAVARVLTSDEIKLINESKRQQLINEANEKIAILQDIIDLDMQESNNEDEQLKQWKKYRILVTRVDTSDVNVVLPEKPVN